MEPKIPTDDWPSLEGIRMKMTLEEYESAMMCISVARNNLLLLSNRLTHTEIGDEPSECSMGILNSVTNGIPTRAFFDTQNTA